MLSWASATLSCASGYEPKGQFWPDLEPDGVDVGADPAEPDNGADAPGGSTEDATARDLGTSNNVMLGSGSNAGTNSAGNSGATPATGSSSSGGGSSPTTSSGGGSTTPVAASASCSLSVSVTTTAPGGKYAPRNVGAIWIADAGGAFVKSLDVWGNRRLSHVTAWNAATKAAGVAGNKVDAITAATLSAHREHDATWNCKDYAGKVVPDGTYRVYFEVADSNNSGPNHFESFVKGPSATSAQSSATNFNGIALTFKP